MQSFDAKLTLLLKRLTIANGRLAAELGVDKSVVARWTRGSGMPTAHNLGRLTEYLAQRMSEGFCLLDWEIPFEAFRARFAPPAQGTHDVLGVAQWLGFHRLRPDSGSTDLGERARGFWLSLSPMPDMPNQLAQGVTMVRPGCDGRVRLDLGFHVSRGVGWGVQMGNQVFGCVPRVDDGRPTFIIGSGVDGPKLEVLEGVLLSSRVDNGGAVLAVPYVMTRVADLANDPETDAETFEALLRRPPLVDIADVDPAIAARLARAGRNGGDLTSLLVSALPLSGSVGQTPDQWAHNSRADDQRRQEPGGHALTA